MRPPARLLPLATAVMAAGSLVAATPLPYGGVPTHYSYAALADMALTAPIMVSADIAHALPLKGDQAAGVPTGMTRYYVEARVRALVSGQVELPAVITYLVDLPNDERGHPLKLKDVPVLLLGSAGTGAGEFRLIAPRAQVPRTPENEARLRAILGASVAPDAPPAITGVSRAFQVAGSLPGEGETQIFLRTGDGRPVSLSILRRPGEAPRWAVALSELVDDSAAPPPRDSLLWYRLACGLPPALPDGATAELADADGAIAREDYRLVLDGLGPCARD